MIIDSKINNESLKNKYIQDKIYCEKDNTCREKGIAAVEDICDAIYQGCLFEDGIVGYGHGTYYSGNLNSIVNEIVANYTELKVTQNTSAIENLKTIMGNDLFALVDNLYENIISKENG